MTACDIDIDFDLVFREDDFRQRFLRGEEEKSGFADIEAKAKAVLSDEPWCPPTTETYVAAYCPPIVAVFLYRIDTQHPVALEDEDGFLEWAWVLVGDLPPLYILYMPIADGLDALRCYVGVYQTWLKRFDAGLPLEEIADLKVPHDEEHAEMLRVRAKLLTEFFLENERPPLFPGSQG
ncbi:hypothetical protein [Denitrobaculum tricleocarpae]|uniref:Uncharacterized protein n=1 Tax=Denitrobaculum tricleocarpae TaxID=2591009 RepID=A0A545TU93_9PROT|nr:hypothetical protein [Denitrobaculum tricleocarpae]TQV80787.1 hypothetical protein FKG95_11600 [Denitrobaculum tricleocarpae]